ncbi:hypothetical protein V8F33_011042 [Rhypophila sp. PSN 637]
MNDPSPTRQDAPRRVGPCRREEGRLARLPAVSAWIVAVSSLVLFAGATSAGEMAQPSKRCSRFNIRFCIRESPVQLRRRPRR